MAVNMGNNRSNGATFGGQHAVVIGGSMAGLLATWILSDHFERVTLVERDTLPDRPEPRKGVPQGRHAHALLKKGEVVLGQMFPGFLSDLVENGGLPIDMSGDTRWFHYGEWKARFNSGMLFYCQSRGMLEWRVRHHVATKPNVRIIDNADVDRLLSDADRSHVTGAHLVRRGPEPGEEDLLAELVVEAGGRGTRAPQWLEALGYLRPEESSVKMDVGYASRIYRRPQNFQADWRALLVYPTPPGKRLAAIFPIENDTWMVTLGGWCGDHPPADEEGFLEFARSLEAPDVYTAIKDAEPITPIAIHKLPSNLRRHYERMPHFPEGFVVVGDAVCSFNPIYGQGMTTSSLDALALDACLREQPRRRAPGDITGLSKRFHKKIARIIDIPWLLASSEDFRFQETEGRRPFWLPLLNWYTGYVHRLTAHSDLVFYRFLQVMHMMKHPIVLFDPRVIFRVLTWRLRRQGAKSPVADEPQSQPRVEATAP